MDLDAAKSADPAATESDGAATGPVTDAERAELNEKIKAAEEEVANTQAVRVLLSPGQTLPC